MIRKLIFLLEIVLVVGVVSCRPVLSTEPIANPLPTMTVNAAAAPTLTAAPTVTAAEPFCATGDAPDFSNYLTWTKINSEPIKGHEVDVIIYVNDLAKELYISASGDLFPVCSIIVKPHLNANDLETITAVTVMVKMPEGYDPDHNDWWWGMYDGEGVNAEMQGKVEVCIACHLPAEADDYVFSRQVMAEINGP